MQASPRAKQAAYRPLFDADSSPEQEDIMPTVPTMELEEVRRKNEAFTELLMHDRYRCAAHNLLRSMSPDALLAFAVHREATSALSVLRLVPRHARLERLEDEEIAAALRSRQLSRLEKAFVLRRHSSAVSRLLRDGADEFGSEELLEVAFLGGPVEPVFMHFLSGGHWEPLRALLSYLRGLDGSLEGRLRAFVDDWGAVLAGFPELDVPDDLLEVLRGAVDCAGAK